MGWGKRARETNAAKETCLGQEMVAETLGVLENVGGLVALERIRQEVEILRWISQGPFLFSVKDIVRAKCLCTN